MAISWLEKFANECGDHPPDKTFKKRVLPACYTKLTVYQTYVAETDLFERKKISYSRFADIWGIYCSHISISKVEILFSYYNKTVTSSSSSS